MSHTQRVIDVNGQVHYGRRATVCDVTAVLDDGDEVTVVGEAILYPGDRRDPNIGSTLAVGRALQSLGEKLERRANGWVKHHDDVGKCKSAPERRGKLHNAVLRGLRVLESEET